MSNLNASNSTVEVIAQEVKGTQESEVKVQSRLVYYVSRFKTRKGGQIRLGEYGSVNDSGEVKALATLHIKYAFISGLPAAMVTPKGTHWSMDRTEDAGFLSIQVNFSPAQMMQLEKQLTEEVKNLWSNPPKDGNFKSELRGYQIHVVLKTGAMARIQIENNDYKEGKENLILDPSEVKSVEIVTAESEVYARPGDQVALDAYIETFFKSATNNIAQTPEQVKALLSRRHAEASAGKNVKNRYCRGNKAAEASAAETKVTTTEQMG